MDQLDGIVSYIALDNPAAAEKLGERLIALGESLASFPNRGRPAPQQTRELTGVPPYVLRYRVVGDVVLIVDIRHGARRPID